MPSGEELGPGGRREALPPVKKRVLARSRQPKWARQLPSSGPCQEAVGGSVSQAKVVCLPGGGHLALGGRAPSESCSTPSFSRAYLSYRPFLQVEPGLSVLLYSVPMHQLKKELALQLCASANLDPRCHDSRAHMFVVRQPSTRNFASLGCPADLPSNVRAGAPLTPQSSQA